MASRYVPKADFVPPSEPWGEEEQWQEEGPPEDDWGAPTEISVAPRKTGPAEVQSGRQGYGPAGGVGPGPAAAAGGYSAEELAALADEDDWGAAPGNTGAYGVPPPAPQQQQYGGGLGGSYGSRTSYGAQPAPQQYGVGAADAGAPAAGAFLCPTCGGECSLRTSNTQKNPGRQFYKCPNQACNTFKWADEVVAGGDAGSGYRSPASKRRITGYTGSQGQYGASSEGGAYQPGYGYGGGGAGGPPPVPGANTLQAAADGAALRDRSNDVCYKCNGVGHWASNCPASGGGGAAAGGAAGGGSCYKCGQTGHWARDCPNEGGTGGGGAGGYAGSKYKAGGGGGSTWGGPQGGAGTYGGAGGSAYGGGVGGGGGATGDCFKCGQPGHWSRDCPNQGGGGAGGGARGGFGGGGAGGGYGGGSYGGGGGGGKGDCYKCGGSGHWARDCPGGGAGGAAGGKRKWDGGGGGGYGRGSARGDAGACFKCGGDHFSRDCPNK